MSEFPKSLYRRGTGFEWCGVALDGITVADAGGEALARKDGWTDAADALRDPLDHDGDGRKGGSRKRKP
jgi:hypothetical protein